MRTPCCLFFSLSIAGFCSPATALDFANISLGSGSLIVRAGGEVEPGGSLKLTSFLEAVQAQKVCDSGIVDRKAGASWFGAETGAARGGVAFRAGQRSLPHHATFSAAGQANPQDWVTGCQQAAQMPGPFDVRRRREPDDKRGWNAI